MIFPDGVIRRAFKNVYFIWGSGKTTAANALAERHGFYVYHTDESRSRHFQNADPNDQPAMCRDVPDFWALEPEDALAWEGAVVKEMTPMIVAELIGLAAQHKGVICEGDIDIDQIAPVAANAVTISNHGAEYDFFSRPERRICWKRSRAERILTKAKSKGGSRMLTVFCDVRRGTVLQFRAKRGFTELSRSSGTALQAWRR